MIKLNWEDKDTHFIAWLPILDASCLEVCKTEEPGKGYRWTVWHQGGYASNVEAAKAACEAAVRQSLVSVLDTMGCDLTTHVRRAHVALLAFRDGRAMIKKLEEQIEAYKKALDEWEQKWWDTLGDLDKRVKKLEGA